MVCNKGCIAFAQLMVDSYPPSQISVNQSDIFKVTAPSNTEAINSIHGVHVFQCVQTRNLTKIYFLPH